MTCHSDFSREIDKIFLEIGKKYQERKYAHEQGSAQKILVGTPNPSEPTFWVPPWNPEPTLTQFAWNPEPIFLKLGWVPPGSQPPAPANEFLWKHTKAPSYNRGICDNEKSAFWTWPDPIHESWLKSSRPRTFFKNASSIELLFM